MFFDGNRKEARKKEEPHSVRRSFWRTGSESVIDLPKSSRSHLEKKRPKQHPLCPALAIHSPDSGRPEAKSNRIPLVSANRPNNPTETIYSNIYSPNFLTRYIERNLVEWAETVYTRVGPQKKEIVYQTELKNLFLAKGLDVATEIPLKFQSGENVVSKRADLIVSLPGVMDRVLIECKAKPKVSRADFKQVIAYQHHFGIQDCYLVNFGKTVDIRKLK